MPNKTRNSATGGIRSWRDPSGVSWNVWLSREERFAPGGILSFSANPRDSQTVPKILVRGLFDVWKIPEHDVPFYLDAARRGGFIWHDRNGEPWHFVHRTMIRSGRRELEVHHGESHRVLWGMTSEHLQRLVGMVPG